MKKRLIQGSLCKVVVMASRVKDLDSTASLKFEGFIKLLIGITSSFSSSVIQARQNLVPKNKNSQLIRWVCRRKDTRPLKLDLGFIKCVLFVYVLTFQKGDSRVFN